MLNTKIIFYNYNRIISHVKLCNINIGIAEITITSTYGRLQIEKRAEMIEKLNMTI